MNADLAQRLSQANDTARCGARTRSGAPCRCPAMPNGKCRIHGGASPGAPRGLPTAATFMATGPAKRSRNVGLFVCC